MPYRNVIKERSEKQERLCSLIMPNIFILLGTLGLTFDYLQINSQSFFQNIKVRLTKFLLLSLGRLAAAITFLQHLDTAH